MSTTAFELRSEFAEEHGHQPPEGEDSPFERSTVFQGGLLHTSWGDLDIAEELDRGDGKIVVDDSDTQLITLLDAYPPLKRGAGTDAEPTVSRYRLMNIEELRQEASRRDLEGAGGLNKAQLIHHFEAQDAGQDPDADVEDPRLKQNREALNELARSAGVQEPEKLGNKAEVLEAIDNQEGNR